MWLHSQGWGFLWNFNWQLLIFLGVVFLSCTMSKDKARGKEGVCVQRRGEGKKRESESKNECVGQFVLSFLVVWRAICHSV